MRHRRLVPVTAVFLIVSAIAAIAIVMARRSPSPALTDRDPVVLAFENRTGESAFDDPMPLALAIQLEQSPFLQVVASDKVRQTLELMKRGPDTPITRQVGLEICERVGGPADG